MRGLDECMCRVRPCSVWIYRVLSDVCGPWCQGRHMQCDSLMSEIYYTDFQVGTMQFYGCI